ncbi:ABC transporter substrate-binding protein [uncultured Devosia sp.]|uniref:ABC transporter substrate-binding protein n=1 Tax=uncultured Devosia sp. TaxID=211434 RepID=UPI0035C9E0B1
MSIEKTLLAGPVTNRRTLLKGAAAGLAFGALSAPWVARAQSKAIVKFSVWGDTGSDLPYAKAISDFNAAHPELDVQLQTIPYGQYYQQLDTSITGGQPADLMRFEYQTVGRYAQAAVLKDLSSDFDANVADDYLPAFWLPVHKQEGIFAIPQNTDTFGTFYNKTMFDELGIQAPTDIAKSWTWQQFIDVAQKLVDSKKVPYGFAMGWGQGAAYRSLPFFFQHDAHLLSEDQKSCALGSPASIETIAWLQSWFQKGLVPPNTSVKSQERPDILFANGTLGMWVGGDWTMPDLENNIGDRFEWGTTYMPRDVNMASDLGGSCVGVAQGSQHPDEAVAFLKYLMSPQVQVEFLGASQYLPVRKSILGQIAYKSRTNERQVFVQQAATVPAELSSNYALPYFAKMNTVLTDQLDLAFTANQTPEVTAANIVAGIDQVIADNA